MARRQRQGIVALAVVALVAAAGLVGVRGTGTEVAAAAKAGDGEMPGALGAHMEQLLRAVPGNGGESREGPGSAADAAFAAHAYPAKSISLDKLKGAMKAYKKAAKRAARADGRVGRWDSIGPTEALYPRTPFRNVGNYVPNRYVAGGRTTSIAISHVCKPGNCRMWVTPAGGGVWRTMDALRGDPKWKYLGGPLGINAVGAVTVDPNDRKGKTIYVGTGEANICGSGCVAGVGLYKSTNGGNTWRGPLGARVLSGKGIGEILVEPGRPNTIYVGTTTALRGMSPTCCSGVTRPVPGAAKWGLYKSTNGGRSWRFIHNGTRNESQCTGSADEFANLGACSPRGVRHLKFDPTDPRIIYASSYARGVWRSSDRGANWVQIKESLNPLIIQTRAAIDVTKLRNGKTRMYVHEGNFGDPYSRLFRSDDVRTGTPTFRDLTSANPADPGYATYNQCQGQCWYDIFVYTPKGHPNIVYTGGSYVYDETGGLSNGRGVVLSTNAGVSGTDMTFDGTDPVHPNGLHPDQHDMVTHPRNPFRFWETNDGGVMQNNGKFVNRSSWCNDRDLSGDELSRCRQLLSRIPKRLDGVNRTLNTLQIIQFSASPHERNLWNFGTQDNGTWQSYGNQRTWKNIMIGDGGWTGFDAKVERFRLHNFFDVSPEVNFHRGKIGKWIWTADPLFGIPGNQFYAPVITDPRVSGTMFAGTGRTVFRTKTFGLGNRSMAEAQRICNTWTGTFEEQCGDWQPLGSPDLTSADRGDREGGAVSRNERTRADTNTMWAGTTTGRVFVSKNVAAEPASSVRWTRIDKAHTPNRFVSSIDVDPKNGNHAWISYSGYNATTPDTRGHVFEVWYNPNTGKARWINRSYNFGDLPVNDMVVDDRTGAIYAATDFGVLRLARGSRSWLSVDRGMPNVVMTDLSLDPRIPNVLYGGTHGLGAWRLRLR